MSQLVRPQLVKTPTKTSISAKDAIASKDWIVQRKWDGMRVLVHVLPEQGKTLIYSRTGQDMRDQFPELQNLHEHFDYPAILDGEVVAMDPQKPDAESLELLQMRLGDKKARRQADIPVTVKFFDVLAAKLGEKDLQFDGSKETAAKRLEALKLLLAGTPFDAPDALTGEDTIPSDWEGVVAKKGESTYKSGERTSEQLKFKHTKRATVWAYDVTPGEGSRAGSFGAVKVRDADAVDRGQVGSGFSDAQVKEIMAAHAKGDEFLIEVEYRFLGKNGLMVNTAYKGLRPDKTEADSAKDFGETKSSLKAAPQKARDAGSNRGRRLMPSAEIRRDVSQEEREFAEAVRSKDWDRVRDLRGSRRPVPAKRGKIGKKAKKGAVGIQGQKGVRTSKKSDLPAYGPLRKGGRNSKLGNWRQQPRDPRTGKWIDG